MTEFKSPFTDSGCSKNCTYDRTSDTRLPWNSNGKYGGWGGQENNNTETSLSHIPIVFVHGNRRDACDWEKHREQFVSRGVGKESLWAITFANPTSKHSEMADQLDDFVSHVRKETGAKQVVLVGHSLGVTGIRYWVKSKNRYDWVDTIIGLGGANHGLDVATICSQLGFNNGLYRVCDFLRTDYARFQSHPLTKLNADETPGDIEYYTIRGEFDDYYWMNRDSPKLDGANENKLLATDHDGVREDETAIELIYEWGVKAF